MNINLIKIFLRLAIGASFLSAVADRLGYWPKEASAWGTWDSFIGYVKVINPWFPESIIPAVGILVTALEILCGFFLIIGFKTLITAKVSGFLLLSFALAMTFSTGIKGPLDYSVFAASAAAFALSTIKQEYLEIGNLLKK